LQRNKNLSDESEIPNYEICVAGQLSNKWSPWFDDMAIQQKIDPVNGETITILSGPISDQAALHGILEKIRNLNLKLISVQAIACQSSHQNHPIKD